jgi:DNA-binding MarR family transcriptional regulator
MNSILEHIQQHRPFDTLEEEVFVGLQLAANRLMEPWARYLRDGADLTEVQYNVLRVLRGAGPEGLRVQELACRLITRSPDVTRLIDRLESRSFVGRRADPGDGRAVRVHITPGGLERLKPLDVRARAIVGELLGGLDRERLEQLRDVLGDVLDAARRNRADTDSVSATGMVAGEEIDE